MHFSPARWATIVAAAALITLPGSALAQTNPTQNPPSQPPTQTQPQTQAPPQPQPQPQSQPQTQPSAAASGQVDAAAAKQHLTEARESLSQLTSMPEAAKLQGDARTKVSALISDFNALITAQSDWHSAYGKVNDDLTSLLGPDTDPDQSANQSQSAAAGTAGTTGTTGTTGSTGTTGTSSAATSAAAGNAPSAGASVDPAIRGKLVEFRSHLKAFEKAAGGSSAPAASAESSTASSGSASAAGSMPPAAATASTSNPANPATAANPAASGTVGTSGTGTMSTTGTTGTAGTSATPASGSADANVNAAAQQELAAIDAILAKSKTGALTKTQTAELKRHLEALRALLK